MHFTLSYSGSLLRLSVLTIVLLLLIPCAAFAQTAGFTAAPVSGCAPLVVNFTDNSSGTVTSYLWSLGNSTTSTQKNPSTTYTAPGTYNVSLTVSGPGGSNTATVAGYITVYDKPVVSFTAAAPLAGCPPHNVQFSAAVIPNAPGAVTYAWDFGDGTSGTGAAPAHTYTTSGSYAVTLTATNGAGCSQTAVQNAYITVYALPVAAFIANATGFCSTPATIVLTDLSTGNGPMSVSWDFGDGGSGSGSPVSHIYNNNGYYVITMLVTDANGCRDTLVDPGYISVNGSPAQFTASSSACPGIAVSFINTTPGASSVTWDFGDGTTGSGIAVAHAYAAAGAYTVTMTAYIGPCTKTATQTITVYPKPVAAIAVSPAIPCPTPTTVTFTGSGPTGASYDWRWINNSTATGQTVTKNYLPIIPANRSQTDSVTLIVTSAAGCKDTVGASDTVRNLVTVIAPVEGTAGCVPLTISFSVLQYYNDFLTPDKLVPYPVPAVAWSWDFGDGSASTLSTPSHTFIDTGDFRVRCIATTANGCTDTGYRIIHADTPPTHPSFIGFPLTVCPGQGTIFVNTTSPKSANTTYKWSTPDTTLAVPNQDSIYIRFKLPGRYTVYLYANHRGCIDTAYRMNYITVNPPEAAFMDSVYCPPSTTVKFTNSSNRSTSQLWNFGDGTTDTAFSPTHTYPVSGVYDVKLVAYNSFYGCTDTATKLIEATRPLVNFTVSDSTICKDDTAHFTVSLIGFTGVKYGWAFDTFRTVFGNLVKYDYKYTTIGYHNVTLYTRTTNGCMDSLIRSAHIAVSQPAANFYAYPPVGCQALNVLFRDSSTNIPGINTARRRWIFGDGDTASGNLGAISHTYPVRGSYTVRLFVTDSSGCSDSLTRSNYIDVRKPLADFRAANTSVCTYQPVFFTSTSSGATGLQQQWDFGDGATSSLAQPAHQYTTADTYTVRLIVTDSTGCGDTLTRADYVIVNAPHASFTQTDTLAICPNLQVNFANTSTGEASYLWNFGTGGTPVVVPDPVHTFSTAGLYHVSLVVTNSTGCTDTARATVRVLGYNGAFTYTPFAGCVPMPVTFTTITGIPKITWDFSDGITDTISGAAATHIYSAPGAYLPKVVFSDGKGCSSSSTGLDTIRVDTFAAAFTWTPPCVGVPLTLTDSSYARYVPANTWRWNFGDGGTATGSAAIHIFTTSGSYQVTLFAGNATGCKDSVTRQIFVHELPLVKASGRPKVCLGDQDILFATGAVSYEWSPESLVSCIACDTTYVYPTADTTTYTVTGTDGNGCKNTDIFRVAIYIKTTSSTRPGGEICVGESFRLFAEGGDVYAWQPAATIDSPSIASPLATPTTTTTYIVAAKEGTCLTDSQRVTVVVHPLPPFSAGPDQTISLGSTVTLHASHSGIDYIMWEKDSTLGCLDCFDPNAYPYYTRTYYATGYSEYGCTTTDSVTVHVRCNGSLVYIPNTFSPNGDGLNDYFYPRGEGIERMSIFRVYNRWGELLYEGRNVALNDERAGWDGRYKGQLLTPDVYVYTMEARCVTGELVTFKGDITIMR